MGTTAAEGPKSTPDISKLGSMSSRIITVTRTGGKNAASQLVVPPWKQVSVDQIIDLQTSLPQKFGPGTYKFEVFDEGGTDRDTWTVKLGPDVPETAGALPMGAPGNGGNGSSGMLGWMGGISGGNNASGVGNISPGNVEVGHGYVYNPELGVLTTPQKQIFQWMPGQPLPGTLGTVPQPPAATPVSPWGQPGMPGMPGVPGWGTMPVTAEDPTMKKQIELLQEQLRLAREAQVEEARRRESIETRTLFEKMQEENNRRFEALVSKISETRVGPSSQEEALKREIEAIRAAAAAAETRARDAEAVRREESLRNEMRVNQDRMEAAIREAAANKPDPMQSTMMMLTQMMTASQAHNAEAMKAIASTAAGQIDAAERSTHLVAERLGGSVMTPLQIVEMLKISKDQSANSEINKSMVDMFQNLFGMAKSLVREQAEMYGQSSGPAWLPAVQQLGAEVGRVAQVYAMTKAKESAGQSQQAQAQAQAQAQRQAQLQAQAAQRQRALQAQRQAQLQAQAAQAAQAQAVAPPAEDEEEEVDEVTAIRDQAARQVFHGADVIAPQPGDEQKKRRGRPRKDATPAPQAAPAPEAPAPVPASTPAPAPGTPGEPVEVMDIRQVAPANLRTVTDQMDDPTFFGEALSQVEVLRKAVAEQNLPADEVANAVLMSRQYFTAFGQLPPAIELLQAGHLEILTTRLLPQASLGFQSEVIAAIKAKLAEEESGEAAQ